MHRCFVVAPLVALAACASIDPWGHRRELEDAQRSYTRMVRWGDFEEASQWVAPQERDRFFDDSESFRNLRITDYQIGALELDDDGQSATVRVSYRGYDLATLLEREMREVQDWVFEDGHWRVRPALAGLSQQLQGVGSP